MAKFFNNRFRIGSSPFRFSGRSNPTGFERHPAAPESHGNDVAHAMRELGYRPIDESRENDLFIVGFPKSGNTWMQNLVAGILFGIDTRMLMDRLTQVLVPNVHGARFYKRFGEFTCFKSHFLPQPGYRRVVYLVRDGRDAMISYWHMNKAKKYSSISLTDMIINGTGLFPCKWHEHVNQWLANPFNAQMIVIRYEDLHAQPLVEMRRFCDFAGIDRSDEVLETSISGNSLACMQQKEDSFGWDNPDWDANEKFIRKGIIGGFKQEMPGELIQHFENESRRELLRLHYQLVDDTVSG